jgi:cytochrome c-type biogenesis protein CcmH/NrfF
MLRCSFADPQRHRIYQMKITGMSDQDVINTIVREQGAVALATPPTSTLGGIVTWVMPGIVLVVGFIVYSVYVRRNRKAPQPLTEIDRATIERFRNQIDRELEESPEIPQKDSDART